MLGSSFPSFDSNPTEPSIQLQSLRLLMNGAVIHVAETAERRRRCALATRHLQRFCARQISGFLSIKWMDGLLFPTG